MHDPERDKLIRETHDAVIRIETQVLDHARRLGELEQHKSEHPIAMIRIPRVKVPPRAAATLMFLVVLAVANALGLDVPTIAHAIGSAFGG